MCSTPQLTTNIVWCMSSGKTPLNLGFTNCSKFWVLTSRQSLNFGQPPFSHPSTKCEKRERENHIFNHMMVHHLFDCHVFLCNVIDKSILSQYAQLALVLYFWCSIFSIILSIIQLGVTLHQIMFLLNTHNFHFTFLGFMQVLLHIFYFNLLFVLCCHYLLLLLLLMSSMVDNFKHPSILQVIEVIIGKFFGFIFLFSARNL